MVSSWCTEIKCTLRYPDDVEAKPCRFETTSDCPEVELAELEDEPTPFER